jgi:pimeloyl-ACP methyl ester carboxylesterase
VIDQICTPKPRGESSSPAGHVCSAALPLTLASSLEHWQQQAQHGHFETGRYRCRYYRWGRGPALVFIPGLSLESTSFVMAMARLQAHFTCIGYELPSADGVRLTCYRHRDLHDDLLALLDHLRIERGYLLGFSFGATIALTALAAAPQRIARALLVGGFARRPLAWTEVLLMHWVRYCPGRIAHVPGFSALVRRHNAELYAGRPADELDHFCAAECAPLLRTFAARALLMHHTDLRPLLSQIPQPILLVHGERDPLVGRALQDELKQGLPNAARAEIENCGHYPQLTHPEVFSEVVRQFLTPAVCPAGGATACE